MSSSNVEPGRAARPQRPIVQLCIDVVSMPQAIEIAEMGLRAGVDWLEFGTPLVSFVGINSFDQFTSRFPDAVTFLDAKVMDASARYVETAADLGIRLVCLCASASDATFRAAMQVGRERGVQVVGDLYAVRDPLARARELVEIGVDYLYLHYAYDENSEDPDANPTIEHLQQIKAITDTPVGIVTATVDLGEAAARAGADVVLVSHPFLVGDQAESLLTDYVGRVKRAAAQA